jgi:hypothetical protein
MFGESLDDLFNLLQLHFRRLLFKHYKGGESQPSKDTKRMKERDQ